jgi:hypothetical protein
MTCLTRAVLQVGYTGEGRAVRGPLRQRVPGRVLSATFVGAVITLLVILCFSAYRQIHRERERMLADLQLKGSTLIHSLEAGARVGMVGMMGGRQPLQMLVEEAAPAARDLCAAGGHRGDR